MKAKRRSAGAEGQYVNWLLAILVIAILLALLVPGVSAGWYQREITINNGGDALAGYQVLVTLVPGDYDYIDSSGDSIRFTNLANDQNYDYWIEDWNDGGTSSIWVEVPSVPTDPSSMYLWSNADGASPESNGAATFTFFDDFDYLNYDIWEEIKFYTSGSNNNEISVSEDGELVVTSDGSNREGACTTNVQLSQGQKFEAKVVSRVDANLMQVIYNSQDHLYENGPYAKGNYRVWRKDGTGQATSLYTGTAVVVYPCYPYVEYRSDDNTVYFGTRSDVPVCSEVSLWANFKLGFYSYPKGTIKIDWVFVREYASPEPTITDMGTPSSTGENPVPELPSVILFSVGFIVLAGYVLLRRREKKKVK